ncbi:MAG: sigma-54-dependent Fis family transcriptional regulator [Candidatus Eisenbacteria sp.]|nr:sigma-54-dependent Fis family transcriptional regulator [Candidatus Eisenbacteria bacterium]
MKSILVVDDEPLIREFLTEILSRKRYRVEAAADGEDALSMVKKDRFALVLTDWRMRGRDGISLLRAAREVSPDTRFVIMTAYATVENAVEAMKLGACDYLTKPFSGEQVEQLVERILMDGGAEEGNPWRAAKGGPERRVLVGGSPKMKEVQSLIRLAASTEATVLITGETGTGKELVAQAVHEQSRRGGRSFVRFNCAALPETLFESELFGHERGAFTGAIRQRRGRFELAHGGTLLMDEISEMAWGGQAKLLRVLQEKEFERVGGAATLRADVRVIATTNKDLAREIREERFRSDLYYRLSVFPIAVPPLRDRLGDIPDLTRHFLRLQCRRNSLEPREISPEALDLLMRYSWPGNVRELENCLERVAILSRAAVIGPECFYDLIGEQNPGEGEREGYWIPAGTSLKDVESAFLIRTLEEVGGNRSLAASRLGISSRTLRNKLHMMGRMDFLKSTPQREVAAEGMERKNVPPGMERSSSSGFRMQ